MVRGHHRSTFRSPVMSSSSQPAVGRSPPLGALWSDSWLITLEPGPPALPPPPWRPSSRSPPAPVGRLHRHVPAAPSATAAAGLVQPSTSPSTSAQRPAVPGQPTGQFTFALRGDVNFAKRTARRLAQNPATAFRGRRQVLSKADLTMVNLETAITSRTFHRRTSRSCSTRHRRH